MVHFIIKLKCKRKSLTLQTQTWLLTNTTHYCCIKTPLVFSAGRFHDFFLKAQVFSKKQRLQQTTPNHLYAPISAQRSVQQVEQQRNYVINGSKWTAMWPSRKEMFKPVHMKREDSGRSRACYSRCSHKTNLAGMWRANNDCMPSARSFLQRGHPRMQIRHA